MKNFLLLILLFIAGTVSAQNWTGILAPGRAIDWSNVGVSGGLPNTSRTTVCQTMSAGSTASQINTAITNCANAHTADAGGIVVLSAGSYPNGCGITMKQNVTLRGAGADQTFISGSGTSSTIFGATCIVVAGSGTYQGTPDNEPPGFSVPVANRRNILGTNGSTGVFTKGATVLNLASSTSGLAVGDNLIIYQTDDAAPTSGMFFCQTNGNANNALNCAREGSRGNGQQQIVKVTNISGANITITPGLYADNWTTAKTVRVGWWGGTIHNVGIEALSVNGGSTTRFSNIGFFNAADSWTKGVASQETGARDHQMAWHSRGLSWVDGFYTLSCVGGCNGAATGYGLETWGATDILIQNNIMINIQSPFLFSAATTGLVVGYNYSPPCASGCGSGATNLTSHEEGFMFALYEGNSVDHIRADTFHGTQNFGTIFRNLAVTNGEAAIDLWAYNRYWNIVGNVLGSGPTTANRYSCIEPDASGPCNRFATPSVIFRLGYAGANAGAGPEAGVLGDPLVATTTMIWDNYDTVNNAVRTNTSEDGHTASVYPALSNASTTLPASFYLSGRPSWWSSSIPFPAVGPDVSGGNISGYAGHANKIPAQVCFELVGTVTAFNADTCYAAAGSPVIQVAPSSNNFGNVLVNTPGTPVSITITNSGTTTFTFSSANFVGGDTGDFVKQSFCGSTLNAGVSCFYQLNFRPLSNGAKATSFTVSGDNSNGPQSVVLNGTGISPATSTTINGVYTVSGSVKINN